MNWSKWTVGAIALSGILLVGCFSVPPTPSRAATPEPISPSPSETPKPRPLMNPKLVAATTQFGFKLFSQLTQDRRNVFISPTSVAIALGMVYNGANGKTQAEMARTLELQGMSLAELNQANADLKRLLENPESGVQLTIANSLWARQGFALNPTFLQHNQQFYNAQISSLDFTTPQAVSTINNWVKTSTRGKISAIVDQIDPAQVLFLINAVYFKGDWSTKFDQNRTVNKPFYLPNGEQKTHPMMSQQGEYRYSETDQFQAIALPYGKEKRLSMVVFLPKKPVTLAEFSRSLTAAHWQQWMKQFRVRSGTIQLPRFKLDYETDLKSSLAALGMKTAFTDTADFSNLSQAKTQIDQIKHKTFVEVNETGTEAAAVTSIGVRVTSAQPVDEPFSMIVDRPFFCAIQDNKTGSVLFMGTIVEPK